MSQRGMGDRMEKLHENEGLDETSKEKLKENFDYRKHCQKCTNFAIRIRGDANEN